MCHDTEHKSVNASYCKKEMRSLSLRIGWLIGIGSLLLSVVGYVAVIADRARSNVGEVDAKLIELKASDAEFRNRALESVVRLEKADREFQRQIVEMMRRQKYLVPRGESVEE